MSETVRKISTDPKSYGPKKPEIVDIFDNRMNMSFEEKMAKLPKHDGIPPSGYKFEIKHRLYADKSENFFFDGCVRSVLEALGEPETLDYAFAMALCGDLFVQMYNKDRESDCLTDNCFIQELAVKPFRCCGYESVFVTPDEIREHSREVAEMIRHSVLRNVPVISIGVNHIPVAVADGEKVWNGTYPVVDGKVEVPFASMIGGYEEDRLLINVWIGESTADELGYVTAENALDTSKGLIFVGRKVTEYDIGEIYRNIVRSIPVYLTLVPRDGFSFGKQAFYDWAENIENGSILKVPDCWNYQFATSVILFTNDMRILAFLQRVMEYCPDDEGMKKLVSLYTKQHDYIQELNQLQGGFEFDAQRFADKEFAAAHTAILRKLGDLQDEIIEACYEIDY